MSGVSLEVLAAAEGMDVWLAERGISVVADRGPQAPLMPTRPRILLAEDDDGVADTLNDILMEDGYEVRRAADGVQAVELMKQQQFDLVLLDLQMPAMDGFSVCRILRSDARLQSLPILVLTVRSDPADILAGFAEGATDYMTKPFSEAQLRARVRSWLTRGGNQQRQL
jgi:DNA-binding response OmpR family regulator